MATTISHRDAPISQSQVSGFPNSNAVTFPMPKKHTTVSQPENAVSWDYAFGIRSVDPVLRDPCLNRSPPLLTPFPVNPSSNRNMIVSIGQGNLISPPSHWIPGSINTGIKWAVAGCSEMGPTRFPLNKGAIETGQGMNVEWESVDLGIYLDRDLLKGYRDTSDSW